LRENYLDLIIPCFMGGALLLGEVVEMIDAGDAAARLAAGFELSPGSEWGPVTPDERAPAPAFSLIFPKASRAGLLGRLFLLSL
jgi:hypothetical protein